MKEKIKYWIVCFVDGFFMALADSVPGVSGGTVAFILGFYDKFIVSLDNLFRGDIKKKKESIQYLIKIGIGWVFGLVLAISFLASLFTNYIYEMSSLFIGFIIFAIPVVIKDELPSLKINFTKILFFFFGLALVIIITYLNRNVGETFNINSFNIATIIYVFLAAAVSISAMILPGISGSTLLLIFGIYIPIVTKIKNLLHFDFSVLPILIVFGLGMLFGIVFFTGFLRKNLEKHRGATISSIIGMMLASVYAIAMGPTTLEDPQKYLTLASFKWLYFVLGGIIILSIEGLKKFLDKK